MKNSVRWTGIVLSMTTLAFTVAAKADVSVDLTTGMPGYWSEDGIWTMGSVAPGYQQSASTNQLVITALPGLSNAQYGPSNPHNNFWLGLTGDFSATVTSKITGNFGNGGTFCVDNSSSGRYACVGNTYDHVGVNYGLFTGVDVGLPGVPYAGSALTLNLARTGNSLSLSYAVEGDSLTNALTLTGQYVLGSVNFDLSSWGVPNNPEETQVTFSDFTYTSAPATISGMTGGTASDPTDLSAATVGAIYGTVGDPGHESDFFTFYWGGGYFSANVGIPGAENLTYIPDDLRFKLCEGGNCVNQDSYLATALAEEANEWGNLLEALLDPGFYTIGVVDTALVPTDPPFYVTFATPTTATNEHPPGTVQEPATLLMVATSLAALAFLQRRYC